MAITNNERVGKGLDILTTGLRPFVERELKATWQNKWLEMVSNAPALRQTGREVPFSEWDVTILLGVMIDQWEHCFRKTLGPAERSLVHENRDIRNRWAHQKSFSTDDAYRALDTISRLLSAISATPEVTQVEQAKSELLRQKYEEQLRRERRKEANLATAGQPTAGLLPWREIVVPHPDVASGRYQQAEFAADLWQVHTGGGSDEYRDPIEFFRRTFITEGLQTLLANALRRLGGQGGDPVVELQTNFGGGKTHSMLALYHLFSGVPAGQLPGAEAIVTKVGVSPAPTVKRAVLVGNRISPAETYRKEDGTIVRTLWGELAWQLGGREGYELVREADERGVSPGDSLRKLFDHCSPCLILIDEWVAYARQLYNKQDLPGGNFDAHFTFAQTLSESAKLANKTLLVVSIPASQNEIGGEGGQAALERLKNVMERVETSWRPATAEEGFEIVRRRLFQPITEPEKFTARDLVVRAFAEMYQGQAQEYPAEASRTEYEKRLRAAYPIHPELFDRLYNDWSSLDKFQRTRGVLRLMSIVIHSLWEREDRSLMILPAHLPIADDSLESELMRYLDDSWRPVIEQDVDGAHSLPLHMDRENQVLGRYSACRRVARTLYMGSAPLLEAANKGLDDRRVKLGCTQPGENASTFGDALRKLADRATHIFSDKGRYWYSTRPSVNRLAIDRAERMKTEDIFEEMRRRLRATAIHPQGFHRVHACPPTTLDVPDEQEARLVLLGPEFAHLARNEQSPARQQAEKLRKERGNGDRTYSNALVFLAADRNRLAELESAVRTYLAWESIDKDRANLTLDSFQSNQITEKRKSTHEAVDALLPEVWCWLLVPEQPQPSEPLIEWSEFRLQGNDPLDVRASRKLQKEGRLLTTFAGTLLRLLLDRIPLWRGNHVEIQQLAEDFPKYLYLPRLLNTKVLLDAIHDGLRRLTWDKETFAYADSWDEAKQRYVGLVAGNDTAVQSTGGAALVRPEVAQQQMKADETAQGAAATSGGGATSAGTTGTGSGDKGGTGTGAATPPPPPLRRFHGSVQLDSMRMTRDAADIAEAIVQHLAATAGAEVTITLEIEAKLLSGAPEQLVRTVTENARTLKFGHFGFEEE